MAKVNEQLKANEIGRRAWRLHWQTCGDCTVSCGPTDAQYRQAEEEVEAEWRK